MKNKVVGIKQHCIHKVAPKAEVVIPKLFLQNSAFFFSPVEVEVKV